MKYKCVYAWSRYLYDFYTYSSLLLSSPYICVQCLFDSMQRCVRVALVTCSVSYFLTILIYIFLARSSLFTVLTQATPIYTYIWACRYYFAFTVLCMGVRIHLFLYSYIYVNIYCPCSWSYIYIYMKAYCQPLLIPYILYVYAYQYLFWSHICYIYAISLCC